MQRMSQPHEVSNPTSAQPMSRQSRATDSSSASASSSLPAAFSGRQTSLEVRTGQFKVFLLCITVSGMRIILVLEKIPNDKGRSVTRVKPKPDNLSWMHLASYGRVGLLFWKIFARWDKGQL